MEYNEACWQWFGLYRFSGKEVELKENLKKLAEKFQMSKTMMLAPAILQPYTATYEAINSIEVLTKPSKEPKEAEVRIHEQHALATLYARIRDGISSAKPEIKRQGARKWQNKLKGGDGRRMKETMFKSLNLIEKIAEEADIRHEKAVESYYQLKLINCIKTYDEAIIAREIKEALPVVDEFDSVRDALDSAAVILRTMAEYKDEFADWAPPSKGKLREIHEHKQKVGYEDEMAAISPSKRPVGGKKPKKTKEDVKLPPITPKNGGQAGDDGKSKGQDGKKADEQKSEGKTTGNSILDMLGPGETIGEKYERELRNNQARIALLERENNAAQGQIRFLYASLTQEKKAMLRTAYDFELPPQAGDEDEDEEDDEDALNAFLGAQVSEVDEKEKKKTEKKSLTMLHTALEQHKRQVNLMLKKSKQLGGTIVLYDDYGNCYINDVNLAKRIVDPREFKPKKKSKSSKPGSKRTSAVNSPKVSARNRTGGMATEINGPGEYVLVSSMILHMDWDPTKAKKDNDESFPEQYLRDASHLHRELAFTNPAGLAASLRYAADLCMRSRDFGAALGLYEKVVDIRRRKMGENDPEVAQSIEYLGEIYAQLGQKDKALLLQEEALNMRLNIHGNSHIDVAQNLRSIATLQAMHGDFSEAVTLYTRSLNILLKNFHKSHPQVEMVKVQLQMARQQKKEKLKQDRLDLHEQMKDPNYAASAVEEPEGDEVVDDSD